MKDSKAVEKQLTFSTSERNFSSVQESSTEHVDKSINSSSESNQATQESAPNIDGIQSSTNGTSSQKHFVTARPFKEMPGHTGFLTFASLFPYFDE